MKSPTSSNVSELSRRGWTKWMTRSRNMPTTFSGSLRPRGTRKKLSLPMGFFSKVITFHAQAARSSTDSKEVKKKERLAVCHMIRTRSFFVHVSMSFSTVVMFFVHFPFTFTCCSSFSLFCCLSFHMIFTCVFTHLPLQDLLRLLQLTLFEVNSTQFCCKDFFIIAIVHIPSALHQV